VDVHTVWFKLCTPLCSYCACTTVNCYNIIDTCRSFWAAKVFSAAHVCICLVNYTASWFTRNLEDQTLYYIILGYTHSAFWKLKPFMYVANDIFVGFVEGCACMYFTNYCCHNLRGINSCTGKTSILYLIR